MPKFTATFIFIVKQEVLLFIIVLYYSFIFLLFIYFISTVEWPNGQCAGLLADGWSQVLAPG